MDEVNAAAQGSGTRKLTHLEAFEQLYDPTTGWWRMPSWIETPFQPTLVEEWRSTCKPHSSPVEREVGHAYRALTAMLRPATVLETGTNAGYSAYSIAAGLHDIGGDRHLFTLDLGPAEHLFKGTEVGHLVTFIAANSLDVPLASLTRSGTGVPSFDMLVLDSDHTYGTIIGEINRFAPYLKMGGVLMLHDTFYFDGIALVVKQLMAHGAFEVVNLPTPRGANDSIRCPGITIARKTQEVIANFLQPDPALFGIADNLPGRTNRDPPLV